MSGIKHDALKTPITLIPAEFIKGTAEVFAFGGVKYGKHNFRSGIEYSRCMDACLRHLLAIMAGEWLDRESNLPHMYHASCSLAMLSYMVEKHPNLNDLYELGKKDEI